jgi:hypothetical protein
MSYVGMATATGQVVEVPIVLRSLAASLAQVPTAELPIPFDLGFLAMLEVGTNDEQFGRVVKTYDHSWWKASRSPAEGRYLNAQTLEQCLTRHRAQLLKSMEGDDVPAMAIHTVAPLQIRLMESADSTRGADSSRRADFIRGADPSHGADSPRRPNAPCKECEIYHSLAGDLLDELRGIKQFASGMRASSSNDLEVATRRTAGFYQLHEKVTLKEMSSESLTVQGTGLGTRPTRLSRQVTQIATKALKRFQDMPSSHKWTWGEVLTEQDILGLQHTSKQRVHTGYDTTLPPGMFPGVYSGTHTAPPTSAHFSMIPPDPQLPPPPTSLRYPAKLGSRRINESSTASDSLSARNGSMDAIAAMWPSDGEQSADGAEPAASHGAVSHAVSHGAGSHAISHGADSHAVSHGAGSHADSHAVLHGADSHAVLHGADSHAVSHGAVHIAASESRTAQQSDGPRAVTSDRTDDQPSAGALAATAAAFWPDHRNAQEESEEESDGNDAHMAGQFWQDNDVLEEESQGAVAQVAGTFWSDDDGLEQEPQGESVGTSGVEAGYYWSDPEDDSDDANADLPNAKVAEDAHAANGDNFDMDEDSAPNEAAAAAMWFVDEQSEAGTGSSRADAAIAGSFWGDPMDSDASQQSHTPPISPSHVQNSNDTISVAAAAGMSQDPSTSTPREFTPSDFDIIHTRWFTRENREELDLDEESDEESDEEPDQDEELDLEQMSLVD